MALRFDLERLISRHKSTALIGFTGLFLLGIGVISVVVVALNQAQPEVEIVSVKEREEETLTVDVAGAVLNPGVYRLASGSRVEDALVAAGGFAAEADRTWIDKYINRAQIISDGIKIFIPSLSETALDGTGASGMSVAAPGLVIGGTNGEKININTASLSLLDSLWGIGEKRAQAIIDNRPYADISELSIKAGIPKNVYERIKDEISVF